MKVIQISDELYGSLKNCIVDPFDDTPESVIERLIGIVDKSKSMCSSWDDAEDDGQQVDIQTRQKKPSKPRNVQAGHDNMAL